MNFKEEFDFDRAIDDAEKIVLLGSALKTGLFGALIGEKDISMISREIGGTERSLFIVLEALCVMGYVNKNKTKYIIADKARPLFIDHGNEYLGGYLPHFLNKMKAWLELPLIIKGEKPGREKPMDISAFMNAMASKPDTFVEQVIGHCIERKNDAKTVLDLGGGPGKYAKAFVNKGITAVIYDMPETIDFVSREFGLSEVKGLTLKKGDFNRKDFEKDFKKQSFDIVFMGNICHIYSEEENIVLIEKITNLLKKGGLIAIEDFVRGRSPVAEMFAVNMLANTERGNTYIEAQYRKWLDGAGLSDIEILDLAERENQLITAFLE